MASTHINDWRELELKIFVQNYITIKSEDETESVLFDFENFEDLYSKYKSSLGEPTPAEQEDKILSLENKVEELKILIEQREEYEQLVREKEYYNYPL